MYRTVVKNPIHLVHKDGWIKHTFPNYDSLLYWWPQIQSYDIGIKHAIKLSNYEYQLEVRRLNRGNYAYPGRDRAGIIWPERYHTWILRDSIGDTYDPEKIRADRRKQYPRPRKWWWSRRGGYAWGGHRAIRTFQERKWASAWDDEEDCPRVRARRNARNLPEPWDDIPSHNDKCWKTQSKRRHQWKEKRIID